MPYTPNLWKDGSTGPTYEVTAAKMEHMEAGIVNANSGVINVKEEPYNAKGDGTSDDTAAIQAALTASGPPGIEYPVFLPPGTYKITAGLKVPESVALFGNNRITTKLKAVGNINLLELTAGGNEIAGLRLTCESAQAAEAGKCSAIDFSHGFAANAYIHDIIIGSNFYNGCYVVGNKEIGGMHFNKIHFTEFTTAVKSIGNAAFVFGSSAQRCVAPFVNDSHIQVNTEADMQRAFEINNCDSAKLEKVLVQNAKRGVVVGNSDASTKRTTNLIMLDVQIDGSSEGFNLANTLEEANMVACHAEGCGTGMVMGENVTGLTVVGSNFYHCLSHGLLVQASVLPTYSNSFTGCHFHSNGENAEAGICGINVAEKAGGLVLVGNSIGNPTSIGGGKQKIGILLNKKAEKVLITGNRIYANVTAQIKEEGENTNIVKSGNMEV